MKQQYWNKHYLHTLAVKTPYNEPLLAILSLHPRLGRNCTTRLFKELSQTLRGKLGSNLSLSPTYSGIRQLTPIQYHARLYSTSNDPQTVDRN